MIEFLLVFMSTGMVIAVIVLLSIETQLTRVLTELKKTNKSRTTGSEG